MEKIVLPPRFPETICGVYGEEGQKWLEQLGLLLQVCEHRWALEIQYETPYTLSYNYVTPVVLPGGAPAVLKLGVPGKYRDRSPEHVRRRGNGAAPGR
ncbi:hypothetical protein EDM52_19155 [Brevibacillus invocatus]|uniref:Uncharacterized protein n=1 Tax=Brevibacillus invocatus TaxID=173959 RepID=A0A3M8C1A1_9BACL|nr:hypothetical protein [Brevibacillus invocatus]RNB69381.1 hypothetical protein EDM52_19155 [Brevibacillus invocatus]